MQCADYGWVHFPPPHNPRPTTHMHHNPRYLRHEASERQAASTQHPRWRVLEGCFQHALGAQHKYITSLASRASVRKVQGRPAPGAQPDAHPCDRPVGARHPASARCAQTQPHAYARVAGAWGACATLPFDACVEHMTQRGKPVPPPSPTRTPPSAGLGDFDSKVG